MGFWQELRRRRVYRMVGFYVVSACLFIQIADVFFPAWGLPDTALRFLITATISCFPIALIFSWTYDITTSGIVKTEPADPGEDFDSSLKRTDFVVLVALLAIGAAIVFSSLHKIVEEVDDAVAAAERSLIQSLFCRSSTWTPIRTPAISPMVSPKKFFTGCPR